MVYPPKMQLALTLRSFIKPRADVVLYIGICLLFKSSDQQNGIYLTHQTTKFTDFWRILFSKKILSCHENFWPDQLWRLLVIQILSYASVLTLYLHYSNTIICICINIVFALFKYYHMHLY